MAAPRHWRWEESPAELAATLARGGVLAIPTESSYGLAVDPRDRRGVDAIYRIKGRARREPLPVVVAGREQLAGLGVAADDPLVRLLAGCWPAPLSLVVAAAPGLPAAAGGATLAVRVPAHRRLRSLLGALGHPLTATSANRSGSPPVTDPAALEPLLDGADAVIVDDGALAGGSPSTLVVLQGTALTVLRRGRYSMAELRRRAPGLEISMMAGMRTTT